MQSATGLDRGYGLEAIVSGVGMQLTLRSQGPDQYLPEESSAVRMGRILRLLKTILVLVHTQSRWWPYSEQEGLMIS